MHIYIYMHIDLSAYVPLYMYGRGPQPRNEKCGPEGVFDTGAPPDIAWIEDSACVSPEKALMG